MNDETKVEDGKALTNWEERLQEEAREISKVERPTISNISLRSGIMTYMDEPVPNNSLDVVVLASCIEQSYYSGDFDPDNIVPPDCFALAPPGAEQEMAPHEAVPEPQSEKCVTCKQFKWGSGRGRGKACGTRRRLIIIPASALENPDSLESAEMALIKVAVTSVKNWASYVNQVAAQYRRPPWGVVTTISVKPDAKTQFKVNFATKGVIDFELLPKIEPLIASSKPSLFAPFDMTPPAEEEDEPKGKKKY